MVNIFSIVAVGDEYLINATNQINPVENNSHDSARFDWDWAVEDTPMFRHKINTAALAPKTINKF